jgi:cell fate regulator YaaT (PSP1 superfamily)
MQFPSDHKQSPYVEVQFKGTRKSFFQLEKGIDLKKGQVVVVEAETGSDVGTISLSGDLVPIQMNRKKVSTTSGELKKVLRVAEEKDVETWQAGIEKEDGTMHHARIKARDMGLSMKISDVEYQGDGKKAIFYYTSEDRIDFRELVKQLGNKYNVRVEMKQIGARQEAARIGGLGTCGRELCCSTWLTDFRSVTTKAARYQQLSLNPAKLAGQCGKLKCCLNFELDSYVDALKDIPGIKTKLQTERGTAQTMKIDIFKRMMWFTYRDDPSNFIAVSVDKVNEIIALNKDGKKAAALRDETFAVAKPAFDFENVVGQDDLSRFDNKGGGGKSSKNKRRKKGGKTQTGANAKSGGTPGSENRNRNKNRKPNPKKEG